MREMNIFLVRWGLREVLASVGFVEKVGGVLEFYILVSFLSRGYSRFFLEVVGSLVRREVGR